jgi:uncharacterized membrane protein (UPF0182 family)
LGIAWITASLLFFVLLSFWGEMLWFDAVGYGSRFWTLIWARAGALAFGAGSAFLGVHLLTASLPARPISRARRGLIGAFGGGIWGFESWNEVLLFRNRVSTDMAEPILGRDIGFYMFQLPLYDRLLWLLLWIAGLSLVAAVAASFSQRADGAIQLRRSRDFEAARIHPVLLASGALVTAVALGTALDAFHLLYSPWGVVSGAGWTDVHVRLPALGLVALLSLALAVAPMLPAVRARWRSWLLGRAAIQSPIRLVTASRARWRMWLRSSGAQEAPELVAVAAVWAAIAVLSFVGLVFVPILAQWLIVEPNEITFERRYIEHNIRFTRHAFGLEDVEEQQFPATRQFTGEMMRDNQSVLSEVRLWDWRALDAVYKQFQEIRLYYEFFNVDMDRYMIGDRYRQVMVSAREMAQRNLPAPSQTFVNQRFKYTHGYGLTLSTVSDFTPEGLPNLLVKDIPPQSDAPELRVERPQIYYGELSQEPVVVNTREEEFDHPSGDENVYIRYPGSGGVGLTNWWRRFVFGWKFDGTQLLVSSYPTAESRIMFHRQVRERLRTLAPFLEWDLDPYIALVDGRLFWIIDGYTTSTYYPYSEAFSSREVIEYRETNRSRRLTSRVAPHLDGVNYVRNSVKAVIDAFNGSVDFYVFDPDDSIVRVWDRALPGFFKDRAEMPPGLHAHVRYPESFLLAQGLVYAKYHMGDPAVFYNQEDLWVRATEKYYDAVRPVEPYYVMWELPGSDRAEFVSVLPFTPKRRQVLIGWIAGLCDGDNYGRLLAYKFPKETRVLGPQQVETKIDQDRVLSGQLTLWDQRGSSVIRGNVLAIPIEETLIYVEPIYLQADTAAYPELRLVVVMHGDKLSYGETFDMALRGLFEGEQVEASSPEARDAGGADQGLAREANEAFERYLALQAAQRFEEAARELRSLRDVLQRLVGTEREDVE